MIHCYDTKIAIKYGVNAAVILNNLYYWIDHNRTNNKHFHDGSYWTFNSIKAFREQYPYMTSRQIDYALKKLIKEGLVKTGNYNETTYDRTTWYSLTEKGYALFEDCEMDSTKVSNAFHKNVNCISQNCEMDLTKLQNGFHKIVKPIPNNITNNIPDISSVCIQDSINIIHDTAIETEAHTEKTNGEKMYEKLVETYGKEFVDERVKRAQLYDGITWSRIADWCSKDWKRVQKFSSRASPPDKNSFNNGMKQAYDFDALEKSLVSN